MMFDMAAQIGTVKYAALKTTLFDTIFLPENAPHGRATAFVIPVGNYAGRRIKEFADTTVLLPGMLEAPDKFAIHGVSVALKDGSGFIPTSTHDWQGTLKLRVGAHVKLEGRLTDFADTTLLERISKLERVRDPKERFQCECDPALFDLPERIAVIETLEAYCCEIQLANAISSPMELVVALDGIRLILDY